MSRATRRRVAWTVAGMLLLLVAVLLSLALGSRQIPPAQVFDALLHGGAGDNAQVVRALRVPRTVIGVMVGLALAVAGVVMQGITRNPIAEPGVLGVSQGASLGVVCAIAFLGCTRRPAMCGSRSPVRGWPRWPPTRWRAADAAVPRRSNWPWPGPR